jgi:hypothetical protein
MKKEKIYIYIIEENTHFVFTSGKGVNLTSFGALRLARASNKKFQQSVEPSFPILESSEAVSTQSDVIIAPAYHITGMSHYLYGK